MAERRASPAMYNLESDPYAEGWDAHEAGQVITSSPYKGREHDKEKHQLWINGWIAWRNT